MSTEDPRLVLVGGGHAHLEILRRFAVEEEKPRFRLTLVSADSFHIYSGMVPGLVCDQYTLDEISFDLPSLAQRAGAGFVQGRVANLDPKEKTLELDSGQVVSYDRVSFNIGSKLAGAEATKASANALLLKPLARVPELKQALLDFSRNGSSEPVRINVVGGGAAGYEVACACSAVLKRRPISREVTLVEASPRILDGYTKRFREVAHSVLRRSSISLRTHLKVAEVQTDGLLFEDGSRLGSDLTVWLTGAFADTVFKKAGLPVDHRNFLMINDSLQCITDPAIFAVGDCGTMTTFPNTPKAGVYAVRQGPILWDIFVALGQGRPLPTYTPQAKFLSILNTCDGKALMDYKGHTWYGRLSWWLKNYIDRRFVWRYREL